MTHLLSSVPLQHACIGVLAGLRSLFPSSRVWEGWEPCVCSVVGFGVQQQDLSNGTFQIPRTVSLSLWLPTTGL